MNGVTGKHIFKGALGRSALLAKVGGRCQFGSGELFKYRTIENEPGTALLLQYCR